MTDGKRGDVFFNSSYVPFFVASQAGAAVDAVQVDQDSSSYCGRVTSPSGLQNYYFPRAGTREGESSRHYFDVANVVYLRCRGITRDLSHVLFGTWPGGDC